MEVSWIVELEIKPGAFEDFRELTQRMVAFSSKERGTVGYERYVSADRNTVLVCERYADSASAVAHLKAFAERFAEQFFRMVERKRFIVFGAVDKELKEMLDGFGAEYFSFLDGFDRQS